MHKVHIEGRVRTVEKLKSKAPKLGRAVPAVRAAGRL